MNNRQERQAEEPLTGTALHSTEGADLLQTVEEAIENDNQLLNDVSDDSIITLDSPD